MYYRFVCKKYFFFFKSFDFHRYIFCNVLVMQMTFYSHKYVIYDDNHCCVWTIEHKRYFYTIWFNKTRHLLHRRFNFHRTYKCSIVSKTPSVRIMRFFFRLCVLHRFLYTFSRAATRHGFRVRRDYSQSRAHDVFRLQHCIKNECIGNVSAKQNV